MATSPQTPQDCQPDWVVDEAGRADIDFGFIPDWESQSTTIDVDCVDTTCVTDWIAQSGDALRTDVHVHADWVYQVGDAIYTNLNCEWPEVCHGDWTAPLGNAVDVDFLCCNPNEDCGGTWEVPDASNLVVDFICCGADGGGGPNPGAEFTIGVSTGESLAASLDAQILIRHGFSDGADLSTVFTTIGPINLVAPQYVGESIGGVLSIGWTALYPGAHHGESVAIQIRTAPVITTLFQGFWFGQSFAVDMAVQSTRVDLSYGENLVASLDVYDLLSPRASTGESLGSALATLSILSAPLNDGASLSCGIEWHSAAHLTTNTYAGESVSSSLWTLVRLQATTGHGESLVGNLELAPRAPIEAILPRGESLSLGSLSTAAGLSPTGLADGVSLVIASLDEEKPWRFYTGQTISSSLVTTAGAASNLYCSESVGVSLDTRPGEPLSTRFYTGEVLFSERPLVQIRPTFHVNMWTGQTPSASTSDSTVDIDLRGVATIDKNNWIWDANNIPFEFNDGPPSWQWGSGAGTVVTASLQARPRFSAQMFTGHTLKLEQGYELVDVNIKTGEEVRRPFEALYTEPKINLCYPNVFPSPDNMEVELEWNEESCYSDFLWGGESIRVDLSTIKSYVPMAYEGQTFYADFVIYDLWRARIWVGEMLIPTLSTVPALYPKMFHGESFEVDLAPHEAKVHTGESLEASLEISYYVEFLEKGCLENEFIPIDENGDPDIEKRSPVTIEGEPFLHDIKARCF